MENARKSRDDVRLFRGGVAPAHALVVHQVRSAMTTREEFLTAVIAQLPALRRYAIALAGNAAHADDLVQDCIERALRQSSQLKDQQHIAGWLRRILHNLFIDEIRRGNGRGKQQDISELANHLELSLPATDNTGMRDFVKALNALGPEHREILLLVGVENLNYREIADELEIPIGTVMSRLARARERLRKLMEDGASADIIPMTSRAGGRS